MTFAGLYVCFLFSSLILIVSARQSSPSRKLPRWQTVQGKDLIYSWGTQILLSTVTTLQLFELELMGTQELCKARCFERTAFRKAKWAEIFPLEYVSPRSGRILSKWWATQFTSYFGQMSCTALGTQVIQIHLPFGNEDTSSSFLPCACIFPACQRHNFPEFSTKFTTKFLQQD